MTQPITYTYPHGDTPVSLTGTIEEDYYYGPSFVVTLVVIGGVEAKELGAINAVYNGDIDMSVRQNLEVDEVILPFGIPSEYTPVDFKD